MERESEYGNVEYKIYLIDKDDERIKSLASQMRFRVNEGNGEAKYIIGIKDDGNMVGIDKKTYIESYNTLTRVVKKNNYALTLISEKKIEKNRYVYEYLIREINVTRYTEIKCAIAGNVNAAKSSLIGTLISGKLDDGRGSSRSHVFNYKHEIETGRTSSISQQIIGFDSYGKIVNSSNGVLHSVTWPEIVRNSSKIVTFFDLAGHKKYLKTTIYGLTSSYPDICFILVESIRGFTNITKEHIFLCLSLKIPFIIVITKIDICKDRKNVLKETIIKVKKIIKLPGIRKIPININTNDDVLTSVKNIYNGSIVPIFFISNVTGEGLTFIKSFMNLLQPNKKYISDCKNNDEKKNEVEMRIDSKFYVTGVGTVIGGHLIKGFVKIGDKLLLGPKNNGKFYDVNVRSIHCKRVSVTEVHSGKYVCFGLKKFSRKMIRKGHLLISPNMINKTPVITKFTAKISVIKSHSTTIRVGYQSIVNISNVRQVVQIMKITDKKNARNVDKNSDDNDVLRTGDVAIVQLKFLFRPECIKLDDRLIFSDGIVKAIGIVTLLD